VTTKRERTIKINVTVNIWSTSEGSKNKQDVFVKKKTKKNNQIPPTRKWLIPLTVIPTLKFLKIRPNVN
jgi:hypothetical protein